MRAVEFIKEDRQQLNEFAFVPFAIAALVRAAGPMVIKQLAGKGVKEVAKKMAAEQLAKQAIKKAASSGFQQAAKSTGGKTIAKGIVKKGAEKAGKLAIGAGEAILRNPGKSFLAYAGWRAWNSVDEIKQWLGAKFDMEQGTIASIAQTIWDYKIHAAVVAAVAWGGYKFYQWFANRDEDQITNDVVRMSGVKGQVDGGREAGSLSNDEWLALLVSGAVVGGLLGKNLPEIKKKIAAMKDGTMDWVKDTLGIGDDDATGAQQGGRPDGANDPIPGA